jgi:hypothetical protein
MAVLRFSGAHVNRSGRPGAFRTAGGTHIPAGAPGVKIEQAMGRKQETANLDAVRFQHNVVAREFDSYEHDAIYITNNTPHIERLNEGWSAQTSAGFFERALQIARKSIVGTWRLKETL